MRQWLISAVLMLVAVLAWAQAGTGGKAALIEIQGAIGPATSQHFKQASAKASAMGAALIILRLDTPGGLDEAMRDIIKDIQVSPIPVVAYVGPSGARAASAGTYILYASHVAAMAPATNLGAATPIPAMPMPQDTPVPATKPPAGQDKKSKPEAAGPTAALERKVVNDAVAYIRSLAEQRHRNADWAELAVREGASLSAEQALNKGVIDLISNSIPDLLQQVDGRKLTLASGTVTLHSKDLAVVRIAPGWRLRVLAVLTNPAVAYLLMLVGIYGLILEGFNPGAILPGVAGGICLLMALYAFQILPVNYAGLALIALGIALIVAETFVPSLGVLGIGGVIAFVVGSIMLMDTRVPGYAVPIAIIAGVATAASAILLMIVVMLVRSRRRQVVSGGEALLSEAAEALEDFQSEGWVRVHSESWRARTAQPVRRGQRLRVTRVDGLVLSVEPVSPS